MNEPHFPTLDLRALELRLYAEREYHGKLPARRPVTGRLPYVPPTQEIPGNPFIIWGGDFVG